MAGEQYGNVNENIDTVEGGSLQKFLGRLEKYVSKDKSKTLNLNKKERDQITSTIIDFETAYHTALDDKGKLDTEEQQHFDAFRYKMIELYNRLENIPANATLRDLLWQTYAAMNLGVKKNNFVFGDSKIIEAHEKAFNELTSKYEITFASTTLSLDLMVEGITMDTFSFSQSMNDLGGNEIQIPDITLQKHKEGENHGGPATQEMYDILGYSGAKNVSKNITSHLESLPGNLDFSRCNADFFKNLAMEIHDPDPKISAPAITIQTGFVAWLNAYRTGDKMNIPLNTETQKKLAYMTLIMGDYNTSTTLLRLRSQADHLVYNYSQTKNTKFPSLWNDLGPSNDPIILDILGRVATSDLTDEEQKVVDADGMHQSLQDELLKSVDIPLTGGVIGTDKTDGKVQMLLAKEQQDTWFSDMYGFLFDWARNSNIDLGAMQTRIYNDIKMGNDKIENFDKIRLLLFGGTGFMIMGADALMKKVGKTPEEQKLLERCKLYALDRLLSCYELSTNHQLCSSSDPKFPDVYKNPPSSKGWLSINEAAIKKDQDAYVMVMKEAQNYPAEKTLTLDKNILAQEARKNNFSKEFQQTLVAIDSVENFTSIMEKDTLAFQQDPKNPINNDHMSQWMQLLGSGAPFLKMSLDPRLTALLDKNKELITNYQSFLAVTDKPNYKQSVQAYSHMQTMLNGIFAGNNNFSALKTLCPQLSAEMESDVREKAGDQVAHSQWVKNYPMLAGCGSFGRGLWNGSGGALSDILLTANMIKKNLLTLDNGSSQYLNHQFLLSYTQRKEGVNATQYKQDGTAFEIGNATGSVILSLLISTVTGGLGGTLAGEGIAMSAAMREFISGAIMKIPQYSKSIQNQIQAKGLHVNFSQAYLYTGASMGISGMISQLNKTTFASLGGGPSFTEMVSGFLITGQKAGLKQAFAYGFKALMKSDAISEGIEEVSDTTFEGLTDWVTEKMTGDVKYFEGITAENLMKTFVFTIIGMKNVHGGKIAVQGMKNIPHYVNDLQDFLTKNREKYKIDTLSDTIGNVVEKKEKEKLVAVYEKNLQQQLEQKFGPQRGEEYQAQQEKTRKDGEVALGRKLSEQEKKVIREAHMIGFGTTGKDGKTEIGFDYSDYSPQQIWDKARHLITCSSLSDADRRILIEKKVCGLWEWIQKVKDIFAGKEKPPLVILPEQIRNALAYKGGQLGQEEILTFYPELNNNLDTDLYINKYGDLGFYLAMKYFDVHPDIQANIIELYALGDKIALYNGIRAHLLAKPNLADINGMKASWASKSGFEFFPAKTQAIMDRCRHEARTPVVMLYAGLLMMKTMTEQMEEGETILFVDPHKKDGYHGWKLEMKKGLIIRSELGTPLFSDKDRIMLIDDTINTGDSLQAIQQRLVQDFGMKDIAQDGVIRLDAKKKEEKEPNPDSHACQKAMENFFGNDVIKTRNAMLEPLKAVFGENFDTSKVEIEYTNVDSVHPFHVHIKTGVSELEYKIVYNSQTTKSFVDIINITIDKRSFPGGGKAVALMDIYIGLNEKLGISKANGLFVTGDGLDYTSAFVSKTFNGANTFGILGFDFDSSLYNEKVKRDLMEQRGVNSLLALMQQKMKDKVMINGKELTLNSDGSEWRKYNAVDFYGTFDLIPGSPARGRLEDYKKKKEKENEVKQDKNESSTEEKEMLSQETIDSYAVLHRGFSNYLIAEQSSITVLDPNVLSLQNGRFVASTDIGTPLQSGFNMVMAINTLRSDYLTSLGLPMEMRNGIANISAANILQTQDGGYTVVCVADQIKELNLVSDYLTTRENQLGAQDMQYGKKSPERTHEDRVRISENQDFEKTPDDARREKMGLMIDMEFPGCPAEQRNILIDIFMEVHETANDMDPTAPLLYDENGVQVRARSHGALKEKMQKGKTEYEKYRKKLEKAGIEPVAFSKLLKKMMREGLCAQGYAYGYLTEKALQNDAITSPSPEVFDVTGCFHDAGGVDNVYRDNDHKIVSLIQQKCNFGLDNQDNGLKYIKNLDNDKQYTIVQITKVSMESKKGRIVINYIDGRKVSHNIYVDITKMDTKNSQKAYQYYQDLYGKKNILLAKSKKSNSNNFQFLELSAKAIDQRTMINAIIQTSKPTISDSVKTSNNQKELQLEEENTIKNPAILTGYIHAGVMEGLTIQGATLPTPESLQTYTSQYIEWLQFCCGNSKGFDDQVFKNLFGENINITNKKGETREKMGKNIKLLQQMLGFKTEVTIIQPSPRTLTYKISNNGVTVGLITLYKQSIVKNL